MWKGGRTMTLSFDEKRTLIGEWLKEADGGRLWDLMCALRGPDYPSETPSMSSEQSGRAYRGRRARKFKTVEVVRQKAFFGVVEGGARHHDDDHILLPPRDTWDHFDRHMERAAQILGLRVEIEERPKGGVEVGVTVKGEKKEVVGPECYHPTLYTLGPNGKMKAVKS